MACYERPNLLMERRKIMSKMLITLSPAGRFFFGGDNTFEVIKDEKVVNSESSSYIVRSNYFPQQTTLLGMLRFLILAQSEAFDIETQKITDREKAKELIGTESFSVGKKDGYENIESLGVCFVQRKLQNDTNEWQHLWIAPKDNTYQVNFDHASKGLFNGMELDVPEISSEKDGIKVPYNPKEFIGTFFLSQSGEKIPFSDVFTEDSRIGINKDYTGITQNSAFFKQIAYCFGKKETEYQYRFAFDAEIKGDPTKYDVSIVLLGGDNSKFVLGVEPFIELNHKVLAKEVNGYHRVVLTSNSFVDKSITYDFAMAETLPFRFLKTTVDTDDYNIFSQKVKRSERFEMYQTGSVFYFKNEATMEAFLKEINAHEEFIKIGYNQYQVFTNNQK